MFLITFMILLLVLSKSERFLMLLYISILAIAVLS